MAKNANAKIQTGDDSKIYMEIPETFISCTELRYDDYLELLNEYMSEYIGNTRRNVRNSVINFSSTGRMEITRKSRIKNIEEPQI
ncbi:hypothetical protein FCL47_23590 [Desulfopila sp. IMCC35006]|uniref:hypothetical protein n=1 Tax=Desulfopila sp. IMCC35006 TaxID=2569542 RepID=UPI0010ACA0B0|nr:hypothetical protein [Desulfopila sp. IMCC35006]TKB23199.1 hypothetical protein FCL47_23590 [Desulfopila sp. IMCC35006]